MACLARCCFQVAAQQTLMATNWNLEASIQLFFASQDTGGAPPSAAAGSATSFGGGEDGMDAATRAAIAAAQADM